MYRGALEELNRNIEAARQGGERRQRLVTRIAAAREQEAVLREKVEHLRQRLAREQLDVERLEGKTLAALVATIAGNKEARLDEERREVLAARLKLDDGLAELEALSVRVGAMEIEAEELAPAKGRLAELVAEKEAWVRELGGPEGEALFRLSEDRAPLDAVRQEVREAVAAGVEATEALAIVAQAMEVEDRWATPGRMGGGLLALAPLEAPVEDARAAITRAQQALLSLERELADVELPVHGDSEGFGFRDLTTFADLVFDDLVDELEAPGEATVARTTVMNAHERVCLVIDQLEARRAELDSQIDEIDEQRQGILRQWD